MRSNLRVLVDECKSVPSIARCFSTGRTYQVREIKVIEGEADKKSGFKEMVIEGVISEPNKKFSLAIPTHLKSNTKCVSENCHALCRFDFVHKIKYTDVLILNQFMDKSGKIINREITGLCKRQQTRMSKLIKMAAKAGLFPTEQDMFSQEKQKFPALSFKAYWDNSTIDTQHNDQQRMNNIRNFKS